MTMYLARLPQISLLLMKKVIILTEYLYFADVFLKKLAKILPKQLGANKYAIQLEKSEQQFYKSIFSLELVELKIFKNYIEINLLNNFIKTSKLLSINLTLFVK